MNKSILKCVLGLCACTSGVFAASFSDVSANHWAYSAIENLASKGLLQGFNDNTFKGNKTATRYELAVLTAKMLGNAEVGGASVSKSDLQTLEKLTVEFADELASLGVKVTSIESDMATVKEDVANLKADVASMKEGNLSKVRISGDMLVAHYSDKMKNHSLNNHSGYTHFRLQMDTDITENISARARWKLINDEAWDGKNKNTSNVEIAYLKIKNAFNSDGELKLGRDFYTHGHRFVVHDYMDAISYSKKCGNIDLTFNCFFDRKNDENGNDYHNFWNINADTEYKGHKLYAGVYYNTKKYIGVEDTKKETRVEFGSSGKLTNDKKLTYDLAGVYSDTQNTGVLLDEATNYHKHERGWLAHGAINYDSLKQFNAKLAYTFVDDGSNANLSNVSRNDLLRRFDEPETIFEDLAWYNLCSNNKMNYKNLSDIKVQVGYTLKNADRHSFRLAYDKVQSKQDDIAFISSVNGRLTPPDFMWHKVDFDMFTFEYMYKLSENARLRVVYAATRDDSIVKQGTAISPAVEADDQHTLFFEIYNRF